MSTATPSSTTQFLNWLIQSQLVQDSQAEETRRNLAIFPDNRALAKDLIGRGLLTPYQANQILQGKGADLILGEYRILERLGEGAMGQVYKAWHSRLNRFVALKVIHKDHVASTKAMERFRREIVAASQLEHPNIVRVRDAAEVDNRPYMVMDFIDGVDLSRLVKNKGPLPLAEAAEYARQAALGLQQAFERKVVHRDIKPGNLLLTKGPSGAPVIKILDFGLARYESEREVKNRLTMMGALLGTVDYIAPEQAENAQKSDIRADIFSLGCSLYFLVTGKAPFPGNTVVEKITARLLGEPTSAKALRPEIPEAFDKVLRKMMARKPEDRFQTPQEVAASLQMFCPIQDMAFQSNVLRLPPVPVVEIPIGLPTTPPPPYPSGPDPLEFSNSNHDLDVARLMNRAKADTMSSGTKAFSKLMANRAFVYATAGGLLFVILVIVLVVLLTR